MGEFSSLFEMITAPKNWLVNRPFDLLDERDVRELYELFDKYAGNVAYSTNVTLIPMKEEHRKMYCTGSEFMTKMQNNANGDVKVYVQAVIHLCKAKGIPMAIMLCVYERE